MKRLRQRFGDPSVETAARFKWLQPMIGERAAVAVGFVDDGRRRRYQAASRRRAAAATARCAIAGVNEAGRTNAWLKRQGCLQLQRKRLASSSHWKR